MNRSVLKEVMQECLKDAEDILNTFMREEEEYLTNVSPTIRTDIAIALFKERKR